MHAVPIIENTARECELTDRLRAAIEAYPQANAVLVRRHGVYVWGKNWIEAKTQVGCGWGWGTLAGWASKGDGVLICHTRAPLQAACPRWWWHEASTCSQQHSLPGFYSSSTLLPMGSLSATSTCSRRQCACGRWGWMRGARPPRRRWQQQMATLLVR